MIPILKGITFASVQKRCNDKMLVIPIFLPMQHVWHVQYTCSNIFDRDNHLYVASLAGLLPAFNRGSSGFSAIELKPGIRTSIDLYGVGLYYLKEHFYCRSKKKFNLRVCQKIF